MALKAAFRFANILGFRIFATKVTAMTISIPEIAPKSLIQGFQGRFVHTENATLAFWEVEEGALLPEHAHIHEQTTCVLEGRFELTIAGHTSVYEPGLLAVIPSNVVHSGRALSACKLLDVFCPVREDYRTNG
jgi:quercetin dioxygenase-like cupin family protein